ncbi:MAG: cytochrome ubiquinol oxidase subunit I [Planctomycetaceae bacterium]|nr:cytochrome ubiquinol oxidase subunit I [Planctomycetaceae bacterium]
MPISLGFHITFAVAGIALPLLMAIAELLWLRTGEPVYRALAKRWAKGTAILFAVGAVSGTVLSFELGLLWPHFMEFAGPIIGLGFSLEGLAFFTEAIFLGIYIYGWEKIPPRAHWLSGVMIAVSGAASGVLVVLVNSWMNTPAGFSLQGSTATNIDPISALCNRASLAEALHMTIAAYAATGLLVAGIHAVLMLRDRGNPFHRRALAIALAVGGAASVMQLASGHFSAQVVARTQPMKLAAMEGQFRTQRGAPLRLGGLPNTATRTTPYALEIPAGLSILAYNHPDAEVAGLDATSPQDWPPVPIVHIAFQVMLLCGLAMAMVSIWAAVSARRTKCVPDGPLFLRTLAAIGPLGILAIEAGWTVTEVGRQPWIIQGVMRTADAVTPVPGLWLSLLLYSLLYMVLGLVVAMLLARQFRASSRPDELARSAVAGEGVH